MKKVVAAGLPRHRAWKSTGIWRGPDKTGIDSPAAARPRAFLVIPQELPFGDQLSYIGYKYRCSYPRSDRNKRDLNVSVKMSKHFIVLKYKGLAWKVGDGIPKKGVALHDVSETKGISGEIVKTLRESNSMKLKGLSDSFVARVAEEIRFKMGGRSRNVIENTHRKNVAFPPLHDVDENKQVRSVSPLY